MTLPDLVGSVRDEAGDSGIPARTIEIAARAALRQMSEEQAHGPHAKDFEREQALTLDADGAVDVPADFLPGYISRVTKADLTPTELVMVAGRAAFTYQFCAEFGLFAVEQGKIWTSPPAAVQGPLVGDILATAIAIPTLAALKDKYKPDLVNLVVGIVPGLMKAKG